MAINSFPIETVTFDFNFIDEAEAKLDQVVKDSEEALSLTEFYSELKFPVRTEEHSVEGASLPLGTIWMMEGILYQNLTGGTALEDLGVLDVAPYGQVTAQHFGAEVGGLVDARESFQRAADWVKANQGGSLTATQGVYLFTSEWTLPCGVDLVDTLGRLEFIVQQPTRPLNTDQSKEGYIGQVASRCRFAEQTTGSTTKVSARSTHVAKETLITLQLVLANAFVETATASEVGTGSTLEATASIEYPLGTFTQVLFSGSTVGNITNNGLLVSDVTSVNIPEGAVFWVRQFLQGDSGVPYQFSENPIKGVRGDAFRASNNATDQTMGGDMVEHPSSIVTPVAIISNTTKKSYALVGDSRVRGFLDTNPSPQGVGEFEPSLRGAGSINIAYNGSKTSDFLSSNTLRKYLVDTYCTDVLVGYGINDLAVGVSGDTVKNNLEAIVELFTGKDCWVGTICPRSTSTDGWATTSNQTPFAQESTRQLLNEYIRQGISGAKGYIDTARSVESRSNSGVWKAHLTDDGIHANEYGYREMVLSNILTGGVSAVHVSTDRSSGSSHSQICGVHFKTQGGDGGSAISTEQDNGAFFANGSHILVNRCAFFDADTDYLFPPNSSLLSKWGWGRALLLAHSNGSDFSNNDVVSSFNPDTSVHLQSSNTGVELATNGTSGIIAVNIANNRIWYCRTALYLGEDVLAFWFEKNECIKCFEGVVAPLDALGDGSVNQADTRISQNYITVCSTAIDIKNRQLMHIVGNHTNSDARYFDNGLSYTGIKLEGCTKYKLRGNSANLSSGHATWENNEHKGIVLVNSEGGSVTDQSVSRYFNTAFDLRDTSNIRIGGADLTQISDSAFSFEGVCKGVKISGINYVSEEPQIRYRFTDSGTNIHDLFIIDDEFVTPSQESSADLTAGTLSVSSRQHTVVTNEAPQVVENATGVSVRSGVIMSLRPTSSAHTLTIKDSAGGDGQFLLNGDFNTNNARDMLTVIYNEALGAWMELSRSDLA